MMPVAERFWEKVDVRGPDECWNWTAATGSFGRGLFWLNGRHITAPRMALILSGRFLPAGSYACHHCDNPACVNPAHLYVGNALTNASDKVARGRIRRGQAHPMTRLTNAQAREIRECATGVRGEQAATARRYGVSKIVIQRIRAGITYLDPEAMPERVNQG